MMERRDAHRWGLIQEFYAKRAEKKHLFHPIGSMYGILTYIYHRNQPNVGEYTSPMDGMGMLHPGKFSYLESKNGSGWFR